MCMQCMASAMTAGAGVSGVRAYIGQRHLAWLTPRRLRAVTVGLVGAGLLASATLVSGSTPPPEAASSAVQKTSIATRITSAPVPTAGVGR